MAEARGACSECGAPLVPTMRGMRCPRLGSCGRGGIEERKTGAGPGMRA